MKKILIVIVLLFIGSQYQTIVAQVKHTLSFEGGNTSLNGSLKLISSQTDGESVNVDYKLLYEMTSKELTLQITPQKGAYDKVFIPMKIYGKSDLKSAVRRELNGKPRISRAYKEAITFEVGPAVTASGASLTDVVNTNLKNEMYSPGESFVLHFRVDSPERPVNLRLRAFSAVSLLETASGKIKYSFAYLTDEVQLEFKIPNEPCKMENVVKLENAAKSLYNEALETHTKLAKAAGMKERDNCLSCKEKFNNDFRQRLTMLKDKYKSLGVTCSKVDKYLNEIAVAIHDADTIKCQASSGKEKGVSPVTKKETPSTSSIAKTIREDVQKLDRLVDKIAAGKDVAKARRDGEMLIAQIEERINMLDEKSKNKPDVKSAINSFKNTKKSFDAANK